MCRGRRQRTFFSQRLGQLRPADLDALARLDLGDQAWDRPIGAVGDGGVEERRDDTQGRFGFHRHRAGCTGRLQRFDTAARESAAPEANGVLPHAKSFGNAGARPPQQGQQDRSRPIRFAPVA